MVKANANKNARGFHNLPIGTKISFLYPYNPITKQHDEDDVLFLEIDDMEKAQFKQLTVYKGMNTKLITFMKIGSTQQSAYQTTVGVSKVQERIELAEEVE